MRPYPVDGMSTPALREWGGQQLQTTLRVLWEALASYSQQGLARQGLSDRVQRLESEVVDRLLAHERVAMARLKDPLCPGGSDRMEDSMRDPGNECPSSLWWDLPSDVVQQGIIPFLSRQELVAASQTSREGLGASAREALERVFDQLQRLASLDPVMENSLRGLREDRSSLSLGHCIPELEVRLSKGFAALQAGRVHQAGRDLQLDCDSLFLKIQDLLQKSEDPFEQRALDLVCSVLAHQLASVFWLLPRPLQANHQIVLEAVAHHGLSLFFLGQEHTANREIVLAAVRQRGSMLRDAAAQYKDDEPVVRSAVESDGRALEWASARLKAHKDIVQIAISQDGLALRHAAPHLQNDRTLALQAVLCNHQVLRFLPLKEDREFLLQVAQRAPRALAYTDSEWQTDEEIALAAVRAEGGALAIVGGASASACVVFEALQRDGLALEYAQSWRKDPQMVLVAVQQNGEALAFAHESLQEDEQIARAAVSQCPAAIRFVSPKLRQNGEPQIGNDSTGHPTGLSSTGC